METNQLHQFLTQWINKAVGNGGFTATEARDALAAVDMLAQRASENDNSDAGKKTQIPPGKKTK